MDLAQSLLSHLLLTIMSLPLSRDGSPLGIHDIPGPTPAVDSDGATHHHLADDPDGHGQSLYGKDIPSRLVQGCSALRELPFTEKSGPRLPQELADLILDFLWDYDRGLRQCMLVCRSWHLYVVRRGLLAGTLRLKTASTLASLSKSLPAETARLRDVHTAYLTDAPPGAAPWLHRMPLQLGAALHGVTYLYLHDWRPARAPLHPLTFPAFSQLRAVSTLFLEDCTFASAVQLQRLLVEFPQLHRLSLVGVYVRTGRNGSAHPSKLPPRLGVLWLGNSRRARPGEDEENVAGCLTEWFAVDEARLEALQELVLEITRKLLREGELASLGRLIEIVGPHIRMLSLDFIDPQANSLDPVANWHDFKLECCTRVQILRGYCSTPALHELALPSPKCRVHVLELRRWSSPYKQKIDWPALATALESDAFSKLKKVVNARTLQSGETRELQVFVERMHARGVDFEDRTESPFWDAP